MTSIPAFIPALIVLALVAFFVLGPAISPRKDTRRSSRNSALVNLLRRRADLLERRRAIYLQVRELDFEYKTDKIAEDDYVLTRRDLIAEAVAVLKELDSIPDPGEDFIEVQVGGRTNGSRHEGPLPAAGSFCPTCGEATQTTDRFCGSCGTDLRKTNKAHEIAQN
jgi:hypothetical protein